MRLRPFVQKWLGQPRPKQYCAFLGTRTMIEHTVDRAVRLGGSKHLITIIGKGHRRFLKRGTGYSVPGKVVEQPRNLGTAVGVFLAATYVYSRDADGILGILPADHFVYPEDRFLGHLSRLFELAGEFEQSIVLLGAEPDRAETEYGWIEPYVSLGDGAEDSGPGDYSAVLSFHEKPETGLAQEFYRGGFLWNTMVAAVKVRTLLELGWRLLPDMMRRFDRLILRLRAMDAGRVDSSEETRVLSETYQNLEAADFSRDILQSVAGECIVHRMDGVEWSDWGQPNRITTSIENLGLWGNFSSEQIGSENLS